MRANDVRDTGGKLRLAAVAVALLALTFGQPLAAGAATATFSGTLDATDPTMAVVSIGGEACLSQGVTPVAYEAIPIDVVVSGDHTFSLTSTDNFASMYLYEGSFDPTDPLANCVAAENSGTPKTFTYSATAGTPYFLVVFDDTFAQTGGDYQLVVDSPAVADLGVTITATGSAFQPGATVSFTVEVTNTGPDGAATASVAIVLPPQLVPGSIANVAAAGTPGYACTPDLATGTITCTTALHAVGDTATITFDATLVATGLTPGQQVEVLADVSAATPDVTPANDSSTATLTIDVPAESTSTTATTTSTVTTTAPATTPAATPVRATARFTG